MYSHPFLGFYQRIRIELEDKAKAVPSVWGTESMPRYLFFPANGRTQPAYLEQRVELSRSIWNNRLNLTVCSK